MAKKTKQKKQATNDPATKLARSRMSVLELAQTLGNITDACRRTGMDRTSFYEWKRRFQTHGLEGLKDLPPVVKHHPMTTPEGVVKRILALAKAEPAKGCAYISHKLKLEGISVSSPTTQKILAKHGLGTKYERWLAIDSEPIREGKKLTAEQVKYLEKLNPTFRERHVESGKPGELLCQDTFFIGHMKGVGKVYLQVVIDTFGSFAFGYIHTTKLPPHAVYVLHNAVLPFYKAAGIKIKSILTDNGREFCGTPSHPYELYLELNDLQHRRTKVARPQSNGFVERFNRTVLDEFFRSAFRKKTYSTVKELQRDLDTWIEHYNFERPHQGYRNYGRRPADTLQKYTKVELKSIKQRSVS